MTRDRQAAPLVVAIDMGYGHLRSAHALGEVLRAEVHHADRSPLADREEQRLWWGIRKFYEATSRASQLGNAGAPVRALLDSVTDIPRLYPLRDLSAPTVPVRVVRRLARAGLGQGLVEHLDGGKQLLTTFYTPAVLADFHGCQEVYCVVTDIDVNRVWAPIAPRTTRITYLVPGPRTRRRLIAYGVPEQRIHVTGFPLPDALLGGRELPTLRRNLARRLVRLDPHGAFLDACRQEVEHLLGPLPKEQQGEPPHLVFAIGGAGAQVSLVAQFLPSLWGAISNRRLKVTLVAGVRQEVAVRLHSIIAESRLEQHLGERVDVLVAPDFETYVTRFNELLADADLLWTKPSELSFYAALGLPLVFAWPVGVHERYNRRWVIQHGAGVKQHDPRCAGEWLTELLHDGVLAHAAWAGFMQLPKLGLYRIASILRGEPPARSDASSDRRDPL